MLRTPAARLLAASTRRAPMPARALSTTAPAFIRIKKADGTTTAPGSAPTTPSSGPVSTPPPPPAAEKPTPTAEPTPTPEPTPKPAAAEPAQPTPAPKPADVPKSESSEPSTAPSAASEAPADAKAAAGAGATAADPALAEEPIPDTPDLSKLPSLDIDPEAAAQAAAAIEQPKEKEGKGGAGKKKGGARKRPEYVSSQDQRRRAMARMGYASLLVGGLAALWYVGNKDEAAGEKDDRTLLEKLKGNFTELSDYFSKPAFTKLLPDPLPPPHQRPYTLLVDLEDLLVHSSWDRQYGWRTAKRPGVDYFLSYLSQFYEIVLFTHQPLYTALSVAEKLDPMTLYLPYKLFRDATRYVDGKVVKDLSYLNRDLSKVILLDTNPEHAALQPENAIIMKPWDGKAGDKGLIEMIPFLESIGIYAPADVRPVLQNYAGKDIPREYAKVEAAAKEAAIREWEARNPTASGGGGWVSSVFGGGAAATRPKQPMTYLEIKRAQAQRAYEEEQKYYREHQEEFMRLIEEDKQRQMAETKASIMDMFGGGSKPAPPAPAGTEPAAQPTKA